MLNHEELALKTLTIIADVLSAKHQLSAAGVRGTLAGVPNQSRRKYLADTVLLVLAGWAHASGNIEAKNVAEGIEIDGVFGEIGIRLYNLLGESICVSSR